MKEVHGSYFTGESVRLGNQKGIRDARYELEFGVQGNEKGTVDATLSELSKTNDLFSLAVHCLSNGFEESGYVKDAPALSEAMTVVGTECVGLRVGQRRDKT